MAYRYLDFLAYVVLLSCSCEPSRHLYEHAICFIVCYTEAVTTLIIGIFWWRQQVKNLALSSSFQKKSARFSDTSASLNSKLRRAIWQNSRQSLPLPWPASCSKSIES